MSKINLEMNLIKGRMARRLYSIGRLSSPDA